MLDVSGIAGAQAQVEGVFVGDRPEHLSIDLGTENEVAFLIILSQHDVVVVFEAEACAEAPRGGTDF